MLSPWLSSPRVKAETGCPPPPLSVSLLDWSCPGPQTGWCGFRCSGWPQRWLCLPQCAALGRRWSMTSWAASPAECPSWSGSMSTSTWTEWWGSSYCRVGLFTSCRKTSGEQQLFIICLFWWNSLIFRFSVRSNRLYKYAKAFKVKCF